MKICIAYSDVKCHEIFWREIFHEIFQKFHDVCFSGSTLTRLKFFICQTLPFIHLCMLQLPKSIYRPTGLVCLLKFTFINILPVPT